MQSSGLNASVIITCSDCGRLNALNSGWCSNCGCLFVSSGIFPGKESLPSYFASQDFRQFNCTSSYSPCDCGGCCSLMHQPSLLPLEQKIPLSRESPSYVSMKAASSSLGADKGHPSLMPRMQPLKNASEEIVNYPLQFIFGGQPVCLKNFWCCSRQRSVSGPCDAVPNFARNFQDHSWEGNSACSSFSSDSPSCEKFSPNYPYFSSMNPKFFASCQSTNELPLYYHNGQSGNQSISQLSELFMGCSTMSQAFAFPLGQQSSSFLANNQSHDIADFNKRRGQNQRQVCGFRNRRSNKKSARYHSDRIVHRCALQPCPKRAFILTHTSPSRQVDSVSLGRQRKSRQRSLGNVAETAAISSPGDPLRNSLQQESKVSDFFDPSSAKVYPPDGLISCDSDTTSDLKWLRLPTELWHNIVRLLPYADRASLARTCRKFSVIVADRYNWRIIRLDRYQHLTDSGLAMIGRKKPRQLHLTYCRGDAVTNWGVDQLFMGCGGSLESFSFIGCSKGAFQGDYPLLASASRCPNLCHIDASYAHTVRDQTVRAIAEGSVALKTLLLNGAQHISNSAIEHLVRHQKHTLLPLLASLDLRGTQKLVTDTILSRLAKECPLLEEVVLANMSSLTREEGVVTMLHQLPRLRVLDLCGLAVVGDNSLQALATSCPLLEELDISCTSVTEVGLLCLANAPANSLRSLRISFCPRITANAIEKLVGSCPKQVILILCNPLKSLNHTPEFEQYCEEAMNTVAVFPIYIILSGLRTCRFTVFRGSKSGISSLIFAPIWLSRPRRNASNPQKHRGWENSFSLHGLLQSLLIQILTEVR
ncbi:unnamed protein product [Hydatigera taeniaeformis]|uniref:F-box domain-containing protein n=1 Tax=Hydatigena taeniaeformis TaxID=6205 RepID=A0A0R3X520_HYDTA|nr:unnamed protein product [Hydatigera taeniaeformis]